MKYIVEIEEWKNEQKLQRNLGNRQALNFISSALCAADWDVAKEMEDIINRYINEQNPFNEINHSIHRKCNPMLTIISALRIYGRVIKYLKETQPEKLEKLYRNPNEEVKL